MELIPNEVLRMILEHIPYNQRSELNYVARTWCYLIKSILVYPKTYSYIKSIDLDIDELSPHIRCESTYRRHYNDEMIVICRGHYVMAVDQRGSLIFKTRVYDYNNNRYYINHLKINYQDERIIIVDCNDVIQILDYEGKIITKFSNLLFNNINSIAINQKMNNIVIVDGTRIQIVDYCGRIISKIDLEGMEDAGNIVIDEQNERFIVSDENFKWAKIVDYNCRIITKFYHCGDNEYRKWLPNSDIINENDIVIIPANQMLSIVKNNDCIIIFVYDCINHKAVKIDAIFMNNDEILVILPNDNVKGTINYEIECGEIEWGFSTTILSNGTIICISSKSMHIFEPNYD